MKLNTKRRILGIYICVLLILCLALRIAFVGTDFSELIPLIIGTPLLIIWLVLVLVWWRCPHCKKLLRVSFRDINYCMHCGESLEELYDK